MAKGKSKKKGSGKLRGKEKQAFLNRMAAGRRKAERKRSGGGTRKSPKRSSGRHKQTAAQKAVSLKNLAKARSARRAAKAAGKRHPVKDYSYHRPPARVHVPKHMSYEHKQTAAQRRASLKNLEKARRARRHGASETKGKRNGGHHGKRHRYAMSNPLGGVELLVGGFTGLLGFVGADFLDRVLATHALTDKGTKDANGVELYADNPPTSGSYTGLYNPTAICAPMNPLRWVAGLLVAIVPITIAHYVKSNVGRSSLQMFGFGAGLRILGKGMSDLLAFLTKKTGMGQRLYDGEMRAQALRAQGQGQTPTVPLSSLPTAGLGAVPKQGQGLGCNCNQGKPAAPQGTGWPSMPREQATAAGGGGAGQGGGQAQPPANTQQLPAPPPPPAPPAPEALAGVPRRPNPYRWGAERDAA